MEDKEETQIENAGRRKAVKTIVGGVAAVAAYNVLPSKWGTPIIEQIFLPAHAATSGGPIYYSYISGRFTGIEPENNFMEMIADAGEAVSNFIVSEARAKPMPSAGDYSWYVSVIGDKTTVSSSLEGMCIEGTGSSSAVGSVIDLKGRDIGAINATVTENTGNTITMEISLEDFSVGKITCTRSDNPAPTCTDDIRK